MRLFGRTKPSEGLSNKRKSGPSFLTAEEVREAYGIAVEDLMDLIRRRAVVAIDVDGLWMVREDSVASCANALRSRTSSSRQTLAPVAHAGLR